MTTTLGKITTPGDATALAQPQSTNLFKVAGAKGMTMAKVDAVSKDFEAQFISQMLGSMFSTVDTKSALGGSEAEETYQSMMVNEYGKILSRSGRLGVADQIKRQMLSMQEVKQ